MIHDCEGRRRRGCASHVVWPIKQERPGVRESPTSPYLCCCTLKHDFDSVETQQELHHRRTRSSHHIVFDVIRALFPAGLTPH